MRRAGGDPRWICRAGGLPNSVPKYPWAASNSRTIVAVVPIRMLISFRTLLSTRVSWTFSFRRLSPDSLSTSPSRLSSVRAELSDPASPPLSRASGGPWAPGSPRAVPTSAASTSADPPPASAAGPAQAADATTTAAAIRTVTEAQGRTNMAGRRPPARIGESGHCIRAQCPTRTSAGLVTGYLQTVPRGVPQSV